MQDLISKEAIFAYLPHRSPMIMVSRLIELDEENNTAIAGLEILKDNVLCNGNKFSEAGLLEAVAQTAALRIGYLAKREGKPPRMGYITSFKAVKIKAVPVVGDSLCMQVYVLSDFIDMSLISFSILSKAQVIAEGKMTLALN